MRRSRAWIAWVAGLLLACGCTTIPDSGAVHTRPDSPSETANQAPYFAPPGPGKDDNQEGIVRGFLLAMQANPPSTAVARSFLSTRAKSTWQPNQGTIVYDASTVASTNDGVSVRFSDAHRLDPRGAWLGGTTAATTTIGVKLVEENGQWRIDNPPNALAVPESYFASLFVPFDLYFFDRTGTVLVPTEVYVPRGEQTATNLVRGLLAGPAPGQAEVVTSAFPDHLDLGFAVVVNDAGIAEVPLGSGLLGLSPADLNRVVIQLAWTLRQVPGINRVRLTVDGAPVPLSDGQTDVSVSAGVDYDPLISSEPDLLAVSGGRVVKDDSERGTPVPGPFGRIGFSLRSLAWSPRSHALAAVSGDGRRALVAPDRGSRKASLVDTVLDRGTDILRPAYDRFGGLWLVDNTAAGAVVHVVVNGHDRVLRVPGVSGRRLSAFTVTRDGTRIVAALATGTNPTLEVSNLVRADHGRVARALPATMVQVSGTDLGPARDLAQNGATTVVVLTRQQSDSGQLVYVELDGSPGSDASDAPDIVPGQGTGLIGSPDPLLPLRVVTSDHHVLALNEAGRWTRASLTGVVAATYAQ
jgi:hypothetical protein